MIRWMMWAALVLGLCVGRLVPAQAAFPEKPINLTVAYKPGGSTDAAARLLGVYLEKYLGQSIVVVNKPGAGGQIGFTALAEAPHDGYTIGFINIPAIHIVQAVREGVRYNVVKSFVPIGCNIADPNTLLVREDSPFKTLRQLLDHAKKNPGKLVAVADGPQSDDQLALLKLSRAMGVKFSFVPYHGGAPAAAALLGGHGDLLIANAFEVIKQKGKMRALAQFWPERYPLISHVPTVKEETGVEIVGSSTRGVAAPAGVSAERLAVLREAFRKAAHDPEFKAKAEKAGLTLTWMDAKTFGKFIADVNTDVGKYTAEFRKK